MALSSGAKGGRGAVGVAQMRSLQTALVLSGILSVTKERWHRISQREVSPLWRSLILDLAASIFEVLPLFHISSRTVVAFWKTMNEVAKETDEKISFTSALMTAADIITSKKYVFNFIASTAIIGLASAALMYAITRRGNFSSIALNGLALSVLVTLFRPRSDYFDRETALLSQSAIGPCLRAMLVASHDIDSRSGAVYLALNAAVVAGRLAAKFDDIANLESLQLRVAIFCGLSLIVAVVRCPKQYRGFFARNYALFTIFVSPQFGAFLNRNIMLLDEDQQTSPFSSSSSNNSEMNRPMNFTHLGYVNSAFLLALSVALLAGGTPFFFSSAATAALLLYLHNLISFGSS